MSASETPYAGQIAEAKRYPGGSVCRIAGVFGPNEAVPPEAIVGAWRVDQNGRIVGEFIKNPNYDPKRFPAR